MKMEYYHSNNLSIIKHLFTAYIIKYFNFISTSFLVSFRVEEKEYGLYIPLDPFFIVGKLKDGKATLVEGEEFDKIQPLIESELDERELTD